MGNFGKLKTRLSYVALVSYLLLFIVGLVVDIYYLVTSKDIFSGLILLIIFIALIVLYGAKLLNKIRYSKELEEEFEQYCARDFKTRNVIQKEEDVFDEFDDELDDYEEYEIDEEYER